METQWYEEDEGGQGIAAGWLGRENDDGASQEEVELRRAGIIEWNGAETVLHFGENLVGNGDNKGVDVIISHPSVSAIHAEIVFKDEDGRCFLKDLEAINFTHYETLPGSGLFAKVNRKLPKAITNGMRVRFGECVCVVRFPYSPPISRNLPTAATATAPDDFQTQMYVDANEYGDDDDEQPAAAITAGDGRNEVDTETEEDDGAIATVDDSVELPTQIIASMDVPTQIIASMEVPTQIYQDNDNNSDDDISTSSSGSVGREGAGLHRPVRATAALSRIEEADEKDEGIDDDGDMTGNDTDIDEEGGVAVTAIAATVPVVPVMQNLGIKPVVSVNSAEEDISDEGSVESMDLLASPEESEGGSKAEAEAEAATSAKKEDVATDNQTSSSSLVSSSVADHNSNGATSVSARYSSINSTKKRPRRLYASDTESDDEEIDRETLTAINYSSSSSSSSLASAEEVAKSPEHKRLKAHEQESSSRFASTSTPTKIGSVHSAIASVHAAIVVAADATVDANQQDAVRPSTPTAGPLMTPELHGGDHANNEATETTFTPVPAPVASIPTPASNLISPAPTPTPTPIHIPIPTPTSATTPSILRQKRGGRATNKMLADVAVEAMDVETDAEVEAKLLSPQATISGIIENDASNSNHTTEMDSSEATAESVTIAVTDKANVDNVDNGIEDNTAHTAKSKRGKATGKCAKAQEKAPNPKANGNEAKASTIQAEVDNTQKISNTSSSSSGSVLAKGRTRKGRSAVDEELLPPNIALDISTNSAAAKVAPNVEVEGEEDDEETKNSDNKRAAKGSKAVKPIKPTRSTRNIEAAQAEDEEEEDGITEAIYNKRATQNSFKRQTSENAGVRNNDAESKGGGSQVDVTVGNMNNTASSSSSSLPSSLPSSSSSTSSTTQPLVSTENIRVIFTGIVVDEELIKKADLVCVTKPEQATHLVIGDELKRTSKLLIALNTGIRYVVTKKWIEDSAKNKSAVIIDALQSKYIPKDKVKEKLWGFSLVDTLSLPRGIRSPLPSSSSGSRGLVFVGYYIYVCKGVCGSAAPSEEEFIDIIESGGGCWMKSLTASRTPSFYDYLSQPLATSSAVTKKTKRSAEVATEAAEVSLDLSERITLTPYSSRLKDRLIIISTPDLLPKLTAAEKAAAKTAAGGGGVYSPELIFSACLKQMLNFENKLL